MVRLGVIGHGKRIANVIGQLREVEPNCRVVGIVDPDEGHARSHLADRDQPDVVFYDSFEELIGRAKVDALMIGTPCDLHAPYAIKAAGHDLPLFLEKPVSTSMEQAIALERAFENSQCRAVVSFPLRLSSLAECAKRRIEEGVLGRAEHVMGWCYPPVGTNYFDKPYRNFSTSGGLFLQKATHDFDYISYLMGSNVVRVGAMWTCGRVFGGSRPAGLFCSRCDKAETCLESPQNRKRNSPDRPWGNQSGGRIEDHQCLFCKDVGTPAAGMNEDSSSALLEFASGVHGVYTQVFYARRARTRGVMISGYHGSLRLDFYKGLSVTHHHSPLKEDVTVSGTGEHYGGDIELAHDFVDLIRGTLQTPRATIWHGIQSVYTCLAARESARTGRFVNVRQVGRVSDSRAGRPEAKELTIQRQ